MSIFKKKNKALPKAPESVAIIMDGNGRWAKKRGLARSAGHAAGAENVIRVLRVLESLGTRHVTLYAFSTENWKRPEEEVNALMRIFAEYADKIVEKSSEEGKRFTVRFIGDKSRLPADVREKCVMAEEATAGCELVCNIALNYGGRDEIAHAANRAIADGHTELSEELLSRYTYTYPSPDPDLVIRTGGDFRVSNFLLWQIAYAEFVITDVLWPDLDEREIYRCVSEFNKRTRRFGGLNPEDLKK